MRPAHGHLVPGGALVQEVGAQAPQANQFSPPSPQTGLPTGSTLGALTQPRPPRALDTPQRCSGRGSACPCPPWEALAPVSISSSKPGIAPTGRATPGSGCSLVAGLAWTLQRVPGTMVHHPLSPQGLRA